MRARVCAWLWVGLVASCSVSRGANPAERCELGLDCEPGLECILGFCIQTDGGTADSGPTYDPATTPVGTDVAASEVSPLPVPAAPMEKPTEDSESGSLCAPAKTLCGDNCVNLLKDSKHCGACGHKCEKGGCSMGRCNDESSEGED
jgi:hypothetical protein